jgi:uncharacterized membrane protein HdeD (DUF308 family)
VTGRVAVAFGVVMVVLGALILARTLQAGGGATAFGVLLGVLFIVAGCGRVYLGSRS